MPWLVASMYRFTRLAEPGRIRDQLQIELSASVATGTVLVAGEGINATLAAFPGELESAIAAIESVAGIRFEHVNLTGAVTSPFNRLEVRVREEIVSLRHELPVVVDRHEGQYVGPQRWNELLDDPDVLVVDVRNGYETRIGSFAGAHDPQTGAFHDFPERMAALLEQEPARSVAMCCTGGIRCEKAAVWLRDFGIQQVYQLEGGILNYLAADLEDSRWHGECFVFDKRMSVTANLTTGTCTQCHNCRNALTEDDRESAHYEYGVSCPQCIDTLDAESARALRQRAAFISQRENS
jgi:UPF0176 protein